MQLFWIWLVRSHGVRVYHASVFGIFVLPDYRNGTR